MTSLEDAWGAPTPAPSVPKVLEKPRVEQPRVERIEHPAERPSRSSEISMQTVEALMQTVRQLRQELGAKTESVPVVRSVGAITSNTLSRRDRHDPDRLDVQMRLLIAVVVVGFFLLIMVVTLTSHR
jgi:hypothetical protein